jgi:hypothetical protein
MSKFDPVKGAEIKSRAQDSWSLGVHRQNELREHADMEGFVEPLLWTDIGKARSGAGGALVGNPDQIVDKLNRYLDMGFRAFIFSGYPLLTKPTTSRVTCCRACPTCRCPTCKSAGRLAHPSPRSRLRPCGKP